ncbi:Phytochelatin synthase-domain-containing protein [Paraphysoderma sedebokerense]|nr:Phytochelatin synthase-domain-containing protein [Paraphysoderma sedebokerense]
MSSAPSTSLVSNTTFYKRQLPPTCVDFSSPKGKQLFKKALEENNMESYFKLAGQFTTQSEPAFCGLGTLCMVLNALEVDPQRQWKGPWRWFDDSMLDCCRALEEIKQTGITIAEFGCLARCNGLTAKVLRADKVTKDKFHQDIIRTSQTPDEILCVSFHRGTLQQTGMGHFSPVGGYCAEEQMVLILDVARFKYPSYWVSVDLLWEALLPQDPDTGKPRGYTILKKSALSVASSCLSQLRVDKNTFPTLFEKLFQQLPNDILRAASQNTLTSIDDFVKVLIDHIPEDFHTIVEEPFLEHHPLPPQHLYLHLGSWSVGYLLIHSPNTIRLKWSNYCNSSKIQNCIELYPNFVKLG